MKKVSIIFLIAGLTVTLLACTVTDRVLQIGDTATATERPLMSFDFEDVCLRGTVAVSDYLPEPGSGTIHPIAIFDKYTPDTNSWSYVYSSILDFPIPWVVDVTDGDFSTVELVACADMEQVTFDKECTGYADDDSPDDEFILRIYDVLYEVTVYAASTGEVLGTQLFESAYGDCPSFAMFSDPVEDRYAGLPEVRLQDYLEQFVEP